MKQLSFLDANFLYIESDDAPMHVGGTFVFQHPKDNQMTFARLRQHIEARLQTSLVFRRRLIEVPLDVDLPYWLEDPHFDLDEHLNRCQLESGTVEELRGRAEEFFSQRLDREKPLWELMYVEGLTKAEGDFALLIKIHHCAIDGVSGEEILVGLLDFSEQPIQLQKDTWKPESFPRYGALMGKKLWKSRGVAKQMFDLAKGTVKTLGRSTDLRVGEPGDAPPRFFSSPATPFNVLINSERRLAHTHLPLDRIKEIKNSQPKTTVNDVALAICSGALTMMLERENAVPKEPLVAMIPISTRSNDSAKSESGEMGNDVSAMLVSLETGNDDVLSQLMKIHHNSRKGIKYNRSVAPEQLLDQLPSMTSAVVTKAFTKFKVSSMLKPIYNVVITNVPGSPVPMYLDGARLLDQSFNAPIFDCAGLTINVTSYVDVLTIGITTTPDIVPDGDLFNDCIQQSFAALYHAACGKAITEPASTPVKEKAAKGKKRQSMAEV